MSMYLCYECQNIKDADYDVCIEDPRPTSDNELLCEQCAADLNFSHDTADNFRAFMANQNTFVLFLNSGDEDE